VYVKHKRLRTTGLYHKVQNKGTKSQINWTRYFSGLVGFEVPTAVVMKSTIFWDITPCSPLSFNRHFGEIYRLHLQGQKISRARNQRETRWQALYPRRWSSLTLPHIFIDFYADKKRLMPTLREEHRLRVFENRVLRRIFGPNKDGVIGSWRKLHGNSINCTLHQISAG
jgi:hypothetical protein